MILPESYDSVRLQAGGAGAQTAGTGPAPGALGARDDTYSVTLIQDSFFGFAPAFNGLIPVGETVDFSFYGIFWTKPAFGLGQGNSGDDLWTEFGIGANFHLDEGRLQVKPQIGITNGSLLSGGALVDGETAGSRVFDGLVPSLTVNYDADEIEAEFYGGYYSALRQRNGDAALDYLHTWINVGYKATERFSFGPHYELLSNTRNTYPGGSSAKVYEWLGGYIQFATPNGFFARFTAGGDLVDGSAGDFYKMSAGISF